MESYIEGHFSKYNGNAGYVDRASPRLRATPQAFSHFTFCRTGGEKIVVDVQGVGDLLTDPQLHTRAGNSGPGDGGPRGFGLFFATHKCNRICRRMNLRNFRTNEESLMSGSDTELEDEREDEVGYDDVLRRLARTLDENQDRKRKELKEHDDNTMAKLQKAVREVVTQRHLNHRIL